MTAALDAIRARHVRVFTDTDIPEGECWAHDGIEPWPCDAAQLLAALDRAEAVLRDIAEPVPYRVDWDAEDEVEALRRKARAYEDADKVADG